jgi:hypothetical protein
MRSCDRAQQKLAAFAADAHRLMASAVQGVLKNGVAQVSLRFTAIVGNSSIDDVYVDPRLSH